MTVQRAGAPTWLSSFPFKEELGNFKDGTVLVDIGGGFGHQCMAIKETFPELSGKLVLQDLPQTLAHVPAIDGVEVQVHNFFEPQVVKGILSVRTRAVLFLINFYNRCKILLSSKYPPRLVRR
jgi:demethylsterigmatocystin 6-O-methyltransferase